MPLENGEWRETTPQDLQAFAASLEGNLQEVQLTPEQTTALTAALPKAGHGEA